MLWAAKKPDSKLKIFTKRALGLSIISAGVGYALFSGYLLDFVFLYPLFMSVIWIAGGTYFYWQWERKSGKPDDFPQLTSYPFVSIIVPCFNEGHNVEETIASLHSQNWPDFEIIAIDDGSSDDTSAILENLLQRYPRLRVLNHAQNQGKAMALRMGALFAKGELLVCVDGDAMLHPNAVAHMVAPMITTPRVGAVTGNPRIRTRTSLLGKLQVGEFSSIVGMIKRAQRIYGNLFTISGVISAFRKRALHDCGYWDITMVTEDIDISWSLQLRHWAIQYEPNALGWILMPETLPGLWKQRLRWSQGGAEVFLKNVSHLKNWADRRMAIVFLDFILSTVWAYSFFITIALWAMGHFITMPPLLNVPTISPPAFWGILLATVNVFQCIIAMTIETRYEPNLLRLFVWTIWYPMIFWTITLFTTAVAFPRALIKRVTKRAVWRTVDRGIR